MLDQPGRLILVLLVLVFSCVVHEVVRVWVADKLGDPTGRLSGRLTLNPLPHIDPFWTILMPLICLSFGGLVLGGPKPAPINPMNFKNPRAGVTIVALMGPGSYIALAIVGVAVLALASHSGSSLMHAESYNAFVVFQMVLLNVSLAALNLIPLPPFDGSRILHFLLGPSADRAFARLEAFSFLIVLLVLLFLAGPVIRPAQIALFEVLDILIQPEYLRDLIGTYISR
jgi:Zn-dependent protease